MDDHQLPILYIAGAGRSGSTLLGDVLGSLPGAVHIGELRGIFTYTLVSKCSCGKAYQACTLWGPTLNFLYGDDWLKHFPTWKMKGAFPDAKWMPIYAILKWLKISSANNPTEYINETLREVIRVLNEVKARTSMSTIVDTSKSGPFAWYLSQQPNTQLAVVHLVRDPRATLFSWVKNNIPMYDAKSGEVVLRSSSLFEGLKYWIRATMGAWCLKYLGVPYLRVKYEAFVKDPVAIIELIIAFSAKHNVRLANDEAVSSLLSDKRVSLNERHLIGSNPGVKNKTGVVQISEDTTWLQKTSGTQRVLWTIFFLPWLLWFRYSLWPVRSQEDDTHQPNLSPDVK